LRLLNGRVGSTLVMQLLATSPAILFDRVYPYGEYRYLSYCLRVAAVIAQPHDPETDRVTPFFFGPAKMGPIPWEPTSLSRPDLEPSSAAGLWGGFSAALRRDHPDGRWYAEKLVGSVESVVAAGIPCWVIDIVRDPRDVLASIRSFTARGIDGFDRDRGLSEEAYVDHFIEESRRQFEVLAGVCPCERLQLRYEDFAVDLHDLATTLGDWLGEPLDAEQVLRDRPAFADHVTTSSAAASIGRWREDLSSHHAERVWNALAEHLEAWGYVYG
jgi:hypothetical protein